MLEAFIRQCQAEHDEVVDVGGLHIIGTERHEARRIDNQLRGRAGRQGDPGSSRFYLSLEDDLMRIFGSDRISSLMQHLGMEEGVPIEHKMVTRAIARAQRQVEAQNFSVRKHLLEYDDVMNKQRENVYGLRRQLLESEIRLDPDEPPVGIQDYLRAVGEDVLAGSVDTYCSADVDYEQWDLDALKEEVGQTFGLDAAELAVVDEPGLKSDEIRDTLWDVISKKYLEKEIAVGREFFRVPEEVRPQLVSLTHLDDIARAPQDEQAAVAGRAVLEPISRSIMLQIVDAQWKDHLYSLDHLKEGIGLRGYGQRDPLVEYKKESFALFQGMRERIDEEIARYLWRLRPVISAGPDDELLSRRPVGARPRAGRSSPPRAASLTFSDAKQQAPSPAFAGVGTAAAGNAPRPARVGGDDAPVRTVRREEPKVGRNDPCPCGSGKKYKKCHGANA
jgi:preprotein translocase subunit SecA